ncbi:MAG: hypothetical protein IKG93_06010 [Clostridiales bacterium]|nr:hypothetical protein [Clostridiales bacterium]
MNKRITRRVLSSLMCGVLLTCTVGCNNKKTETTPSDVESTKTASQTEATTTPKETTTEKTSVTEETTTAQETQDDHIKVGLVFTLGKYEQDDNTSNGMEDIEWIILAKEDNKILVTSKWALDQKPYNETRTDVTWENCTLRQWLNGSFYDTAFTEDEKSHILSSTISDRENPEYGTAPGNSTSDKVFVLSIDEYEKYFAWEEEHHCARTDYCLKKSVSPDGVWSIWLRSPGYTAKHAAYIEYGGITNTYGLYVDRSRVADYYNCTIRPAMWIDIESLNISTYPNNGYDPEQWEISV